MLAVAASLAPLALYAAPEPTVLQPVGADEPHAASVSAVNASSSLDTLAAAAAASTPEPSAPQPAKLDTSAPAPHSLAPPTVSLANGPYAQCTTGAFGRSGEFASRPIYSRDACGYTWSLYSRSDGRWYLDYNAVSEDWDGTLAYTTGANFMPGRPWDAEVAWHPNAEMAVTLGSDAPAHGAAAPAAAAAHGEDSVAPANATAALAAADGGCIKMSPYHKAASYTSGGKCVLMVHDCPQTAPYRKFQCSTKQGWKFFRIPARVNRGFFLVSGCDEPCAVAHDAPWIA